MSLPIDSAQRKKYYFKIVVLWIIVFLLGIFFLDHVISGLTKSTQGFASYYTASRLFLNGENVSNFYDDDWFSSKVGNYVPGVYEVYLVNMPTMVFITLPVAGFDYKIARTIWIIFNFLLLSVIVTLVVKKLRFDDEWLPLIFIIFLTFQPLYVNISYAQVYIFIFCLLVLAWFAYKSGYEKTLGVLLGLVFIFKTAGVFLWILLAIQKKWKSLFWVFITVVICFFLTLPFVGIDSWFVYSSRILNHSSSPTLAVTAYQTVNGFFQHLFIFDEYWNPFPLTNLPLLAKLLTIIFSIILLMITIIISYKFKKSELAFGSFIIVGTILNPATIDYHFTLLLIPILIIIECLRKNPSKYLWILFFISFALIAINLPYTSARVTIGILSFFAYPKLYGSIGLLILCLLLSRRSNFVTGTKKFEQIS